MQTTQIGIRTAYEDMMPIKYALDFAGADTFITYMDAAIEV